MRPTVIRDWIRRLLSVRDTPEALARGLAAGFFFGVSVFWGLQIVLAVGAAWLVRGNKVVAAAVTVVSNPITNLPLYGICFAVGRALLGGEGTLPDLSTLHSLDAVLAVGPWFLWTMLVGTTVVGLLGGLVLYLGARRLLPALRRRGPATRPHARQAEGPQSPASVH